ncbi:AraC family transcriptional regulator [Nocardioides acrostichi]|uniref:AraC family transcriptional regulator n=1 Tax=Nocardioides acrostichi TaxID=2784339 RepID=UPI001A9C6A2D|nr:helix-turn-helix domain-containing protein [Nocardioides acrostichi]
MSDLGRDRAILDPTSAATRLRVGRTAAPATLEAQVSYLWSVHWRVDADHAQRVLPAPVMHLAAELREGAPRLVLTGVQRRIFTRTLAGTGHVVAAAFRPGGARAFLSCAAAALTDTEAPASEVLRGSPDDRGVAASLLEPGRQQEELFAELGEWLQTVDRTHDLRIDEVIGLAEQVEADPSLTRAEHVAALAGVSLRTLQRRFTDYVGVGPKWVVQRCRLLDVAAAAHSGEEVDWAALAVRLGYADQSHLIRAFTEVVGRSPAAYQRDS